MAINPKQQRKAKASKPAVTAVQLETKPKVGRPPIYSKEVADEICTWIGSDKSLRSWCEIEGHVTYTTVMQWLIDHREFTEKYVRAREWQGEAAADNMQDLRRKVEDGSLPPDQARVIMDSLKWEASRRLPKKYGDRMALAGDAESPLTVVTEVGKTLDAKLDRLIARGISATKG